MLERIHLQHFRCFKDLRLELGDTVIFLGDNAQGKTSILEAVCVLLRLQSPRAGTKASWWQQMGHDWCSLSGTYDHQHLKYAQQGSTRRLSLNDLPTTKPSEYLSHGGLVVWMGNEDIQLIQGSADQRRRYLDFLGSQLFPEYRSALKSCERAVKMRNTLLKRDLHPSWEEIDAVTQFFCEQATILVQLRTQLIEKLNPEIQRACLQFSGHAEEVRLTYKPSSLPNELTQKLREDRSRELRLRVTSYGPHRDDFALELNQLHAAQFASEGQQRTLAISLKLAQTSLLHQRPQSSAPILLIDDVFGELDQERRRRLFDTLPENSQKLITTTSLEWMKGFPLKAQTMKVMQGEVTLI